MKMAKKITKTKKHIVKRRCHKPACNQYTTAAIEKRF